MLDLRNTGRNFWSMWSGARAPACSPAGPVAEDASRTWPHLAPLEVFVDLSLSHGTQNQFFTYRIWQPSRGPLLRLRCKTLKMFRAPVRHLEKVPAAVQLGCIREVAVNCSLSALGASLLPWVTWVTGTASLSPPPACLPPRRGSRGGTSPGSPLSSPGCATPGSSTWNLPPCSGGRCDRECSTGVSRSSSHGLLCPKDRVPCKPPQRNHPKLGWRPWRETSPPGSYAVGFRTEQG